MSVMAATYYNISEAEIDAFLRERGFSPIRLEGTRELVYARRADQGDKMLSLRVYTGVVAGQSRGVGDDAMRVNLFMRSGDGQIVKIGGSKRVNRVTTWKKNLGNRIDSWMDYLPKDSCPKCSMPLIPRKGKFGTFLGCAGYPKCEFKKNVEAK